MATSLDALTDRAVAAVARVARAARGTATALVLIVAGLAVFGFVIGVAASGGAGRWFFMAYAGVATVVAIGLALVARSRFAAVERHIPELATEIRSLLSVDPDKGRKLIDAFVVSGPSGDDLIVADMNTPTLRRAGGRLRGMSKVARGGIGGYRQISGAVTAVTAFPMLAGVSLAIAFCIISSAFFIAVMSILF